MSTDAKADHMITAGMIEVMMPDSLSHVLRPQYATGGTAAPQSDVADNADTRLDIKQEAVEEAGENALEELAGFLIGGKQEAAHESAGDRGGVFVPESRTSVVIAGGKAIRARSEGYVVDFLEQVSIRRKQDPQYNPFVRDLFIPNLILAVMRESGAVYLLNKIRIPAEFYCPSRLYSLILYIAGHHGIDMNTVPAPPPHGAIIAFADDGVFYLLEKHKEIFIGVEKYYADIYDFFSTRIAARTGNEHDSDSGGDSESSDSEADTSA